jgi:dipeptidyl-peptidase 4
VGIAGGWHDPVFSPNGKVFADTVSSLTTPPAVELCARETLCKSIWKTPPIGLQLIAPINLSLKAADGTTTLYGRIVLPPGKTAPASAPLILNPYGGPHARTITDQWSARALFFDQVLAEHGYAVLHLDNRGMGGRGREFAQAAYHNFGPLQFSDQMAALNQVLAKYSQLDAKRLGWWGWSWGGTFTLYAMTHSDRFRAGVAVAPVSDWRNYDSIYTERYLGQPDDDPDGYRDGSVLESAHDLKGRLLLAQGTGDDNVHLGNSVQFIQNLIAADIPYDLQIYPRKLHSIDGAGARTHLYNRILAHFEAYLTPTSEPEGVPQRALNRNSAAADGEDAR